MIVLPEYLPILTGHTPATTSSNLQVTVRQLKIYEETPPPDRRYSTANHFAKPNIFIHRLEIQKYAPNYLPLVLLPSEER